MKTTTRLANLTTDTYIVALLAVVGFVAVVSTILIAWPALAYIAAKLF